jgi:D-3-phosphoglycerate dehydrogenase
MTRIYDDFRPEFVRRVRELSRRNPDHTVATAVEEGEEEIAVVRTATRVDESFLAARPRLRYVLRGGAGLDNVDVEACRKRGVEVFHTPGANARAVGEFAVGALVGLARGLQTTDNDVRQGRWVRLRGREIGAMTVGIIGYGHTGRAFARALSGLGCRILAYDKYRPAEADVAAQWDDIFSHADVLSFHVPLTEETRHYLDARCVETMRRPFAVLNLSRGEVVDGYALRDGLATGKIWGAHLDVLPFEPKHEKNLILRPEEKALFDSLAGFNVRFSAHIAGRTEESEAAVENALLDILTNLIHPMPQSRK